MTVMNDQELLDFLGAGTRTGHLATTRADGRPHVKPIWFVTDGAPGDFVLLFTTASTSVAGRNLARDPRLSLSVDEPTPNYACVLIEGTAELITDPDALRSGATAIAARYMGADLAEQYGRRNGVPGELLVRIRPAKVLGYGDIAG